MMAETVFGQQYTSAVPAIVPDEEDLPGWVPKNYIEKGNYHFYILLAKPGYDSLWLRDLAIHRNLPFPGTYGYKVYKNNCIEIQCCV